MSLVTLRRDLGFAGGVLLKRPFTALVQVTNRCNMKCSFCDFWPNGAPAKDELTVEDFERISAELSELGTFLISIEGGEPFVRRDLVEIVRAFGRRHIPVLYTNGWFVTEENARALFDAGLQQVGVSIDFADAARHDEKRRLDGASERAWRAIELFRRAAPGGGRQVHVMSVLMRENQHDLDALLARSAEAGVGHALTLLSVKGFRRGVHAEDAPPEPGIGAALGALWERHAHLRVYRDYLAAIDPFLTGGPMPSCHAGLQSFNLDHVGNVSPCIEKIDRIVGNAKTERLATLHARLVELSAGTGCQDCWTLCRGTAQALGEGGSLQSWLDLTTRLRS